MNDLIERLFTVRSLIDEIKRRELKALETEKKELEDSIFAQLCELGVDKTSIKGVGTVGITEAVVPQADNWEEFYEYLQSTGHFYLLNRALNAPAYREQLELEGSVPGLSSFTKRTLSVRKAA